MSGTLLGDIQRGKQLLNYAPQVEIKDRVREDQFAIS